MNPRKARQRAKKVAAERRERIEANVARHLELWLQKQERITEAKEIYGSGKWNKRGMIKDVTLRDGMKKLHLLGFTDADISCL